MVRTRVAPGSAARPNGIGGQRMPEMSPSRHTEDLLSNSEMLIRQMVRQPHRAQTMVEQHKILYSMLRSLKPSYEEISNILAPRVISSRTAGQFWTQQSSASASGTGTALPICRYCCFSCKQ